MTQSTLASNDSLDPIAMACLCKAEALRYDLGQDPLQLAAAGLALALIEAADRLQPITEAPALRRA